MTLIEGSLQFIEGHGGSVSVFELYLYMSRNMMLSAGSDVEDLIDDLIKLGRVRYEECDSKRTVSLVPRSEYLAKEQRIIHEFLVRSPTRSASVASLEKLLEKERSRVELRRLLFRSKSNLEVHYYAEGDIIYLP